MIVYFDFLCPFAWRGLELMALIGERPRLVHYSLVQGNHPENPERRNPTWLLARQPLGEGTEYQRASLRAFMASHAARRQGDELAFAFALHLFRLRHVDGSKLDDPETALEAARRAGLDVQRFELALQDETGLRDELAADLEEAAHLGVFGTPTFVLGSGDAAYFRFAHLPETREDAERLWGTYVEVLSNPARIETIKRPR